MKDWLPNLLDAGTVPFAFVKRSFERDLVGPAQKQPNIEQQRQRFVIEAPKEHQRNCLGPQVAGREIFMATDECVNDISSSAKTQNLQGTRAPKIVQFGSVSENMGLFLWTSKAKSACKPLFTKNPLLKKHQRPTTESKSPTRTKRRHKRSKGKHQHRHRQPLRHKGEHIGEFRVVGRKCRRDAFSIPQQGRRTAMDRATASAVGCSARAAATTSSRDSSRRVVASTEKENLPIAAFAFFLAASPLAFVRRAYETLQK